MNRKNLSAVLSISFVLNNYILYSVHIHNLELNYICLLVTDELSPEVVYCPADQSITATATKTMVTWDEPQFRDNSNDPLTIKCSHRSGTEFYWGTWNVHCTAQDNNPNNEPALCQFTLTIKRKVQFSILRRTFGENDFNDELSKEYGFPLVKEFKILRLTFPAYCKFTKS